MAIPQYNKMAQWAKNSYIETLSSEQRWEKVSSLHMWKEGERGEHGFQSSGRMALSNSCAQWIWMQQSLLLLLSRTILWLKSNFPRTWLSGEGAVTNVHLGESSQVSLIYRTHMQIETTKERHSISDGKTGFIKKLVNSTILGFINQNKILQFCMCHLCLLSKISTSS